MKKCKCDPWRDRRKYLVKMGERVLKVALKEATQVYTETGFPLDHDVMNDLSWALKECIESEGMGYEFDL